MISSYYNFCKTNNHKLKPMKKILCSVAALLAFGFAYAQNEPVTSGFKAGDIFISGAVGFGTTKTGDVKSNNFNVSPRAAYFVNNNIAVGVDIGYSHTKEEGPSFNGLSGNYELKNNSFNAGLFGRYYFTPATKFSFFGQLSAGFITTKGEESGSDVEYKTNGFNAGLSGGISYFLSDHFALETSIGLLNFNTRKPKQESPSGNYTGDSTDNFTLGINLTNISLGLVYKL
jgi:hypothetical protein